VTRLKATLIGFSAILMWSFLAVLTVASGRVPPFQLAALTFAIGGAVGAASWLVRRGAAKALRQPAEVWGLGVGGLFGYHALYFSAMRLAPPAEAGLLNYFWPLLIVLLSALLPHELLRLHHVAGAMLGLIGTVVLFAGQDQLALAAEYVPGYSAAVVAAFVWATYSVLSRRFATVPSDAVAGFCLITAALAAVCHLAFETTAWPSNASQWLAVVALGVGPVGTAFYAWDFGVKHGDIRVLGAVSYAAPILSTLFLVLAGYAVASVPLAVAAALITGGGLLAAKDLIRAPVSSVTNPSGPARSP
jgi:drug/metabolite transporter (DMT)-like permease